MLYNSSRKTLNLYNNHKDLITSSYDYKKCILNWGWFKNLNFPYSIYNIVSIYVFPTKTTLFTLILHDSYTAIKKQESYA